MTILITGMHRSGTSMVAQLLHECGLYIGDVDELSLPLDSDNPDGYWENPKFVKLNDDILSYYGGSWYSPPEQIPGRVEDSFNNHEIFEKMRSLVDDMKEHALWGWKDPRTVLNMELWLKIIRDAKVVIAIRNPVEVADSFERRLLLNVPYEAVHFENALNLWLNYHQRFRDIRPSSFPYIVTHYDSYFYDPTSELKRLIDFIGFDPKKVDFDKAITRIDKKLRHHVRATDLNEKFMTDSLRECYESFCSEAGAVYTQLTTDEDYRKKIYTENVEVLSQRLEEARTIYKEEQSRLQSLLEKSKKLEVQLREEIDKGKHSESILRKEVEKGRQSENVLREEYEKTKRSEIELHQQLEDIVSSKSWRAISYWWRIRSAILSPFNRIPGKIDQPGPGDLFFAVDTDISQPFIIGIGNVLHLVGWAYHPSKAIRSLELLVDGVTHNIVHHSLPRIDVLNVKAKQESATANCINSGFWIDIEIPGNDHPDSVDFELQATFTDDSKITKKIGNLSLLPESEEQFSSIDNDGSKPEIIGKIKALSEDKPFVVIGLPTYNPNLNWLRIQIESIIAQTWNNWICIVLDDCSDPDIYDGIKDIVALDNRFILMRNEKNLGVYGNIEKLLSNVPDEAEFIALSDQDDYWTTDKLSLSLEAFDPHTMLVTSDIRIVDEDGETISDTYWTTRKNNYTDLGALLFTNTITGAASVFRTSMLPIILPFPPYTREAYHDHWIGSAALAAGEIKYIDRPLHHYRQHSGNIIGHVTPEPFRLVSVIKSYISWLLSPIDKKVFEYESLWQRSIYNLTYLVIVVLWSKILKLRIGKISKNKEKILERNQQLDRSTLALLVESIRLSPHIKATLGYPWMGINGRILQRQLGKFGRDHSDKIMSSILKRGKLIDTGRKVVRHLTQKYPDAWMQSLGVLGYIPGKIASLQLNIDTKFPKRVNVIFSELKFEYFFGGYSAVFNLALRISNLGHQVRIIIVDECDFDLDDWRKRIKAYSGLEDLFDRIEFIYQYDRSNPVDVHPGDTFIATSWWTAHIAHKASLGLKKKRFIYLTQEFEPLFYPSGTYYALARQSYEFPHYAIFSTEFLQDYARINRIGVYNKDILDGDENSVFFQNAIGAYPPPKHVLSERRNRKLLFYARPEQHARRNAFELGMLALRQAINSKLFDNNKWEFHGIGSVDSSQDLPLVPGINLKMLPTRSLDSFYELIQEYDIGLSLMMSPHPSLMPLDLAAAGVLTVTNTYANKTTKRLTGISRNLIPIPPTIEGIQQGLAEAIRRVDDTEDRLQGADLNWPRNWDESLNDQILRRIISSFGI